MSRGTRRQFRSVTVGLVTPLHRGPDHGTDAKSQREAPKRRMEQCQPQADPQGSTKQAANPQGLVHCASNMAGLTRLPAATLLHTYPLGPENGEPALQVG